MGQELVKQAVNQPVVKKGTKKLSEKLLQNSPAILTGVSVAGVITTAVMAVQATPKAMILIEEAEGEEGRLLTKKEMVKVAWKPYIPTLIMGGVTTACIIGANSINHKRNAALASVYSITEKSMREYQAKVVETIGEDKAREIKDEIRKDKLKADPVTTKEVIITGKGDSLCYDALSGRYFKSDIEKIKQSLNNLSYEMLHEMTVTLNDVYYELGLAPIKLGSQMEWHIEDGMLEPIFTSQLADDGTPCLVLDFDIEPRFIY